jgi:hypothetical protein
LYSMKWFSSSRKSTILLRLMYSLISLMKP